ncbi:MAG: hypothetical protein ACRCXD_00620 [Luteolibacter sp.]
MITPLIKASIEICVHQRRGDAIEVPIPPHNKFRSHLILDRSVELLRGWEAFWNSGSWKRGGITLKLDYQQVDWAKLFSWTQYVGVWSSTHQILKGTPSGAVSYSKKNAMGDFAVASFTASNGIQLLDLWFDDGLAGRMDLLAQESCRHFVRFIENGKFPREIIQDRPPYTEIQEPEQDTQQSRH